MAIRSLTSVFFAANIARSLNQLVFEMMRYIWDTILNKFLFVAVVRQKSVGNVIVPVEASTGILPWSNNCFENTFAV